MHARPIGWMIPGALLIVGAVLLAWQHRTTRELRVEQAAVREEHRALHQMRAQHAQLLTGAVPREELARLRADREALVRLRAELQQLRIQAEASPPAEPARPRPPPPEPMIRVEQMRNAGRATPRAAGETFVWALQRGDIDTAASLLTFTPEARTAMEQLLSTLPAQFRADYSTPERLMAFVMAGNPSVAAIRFDRLLGPGPETVTQLVEVERRSGGMVKDKVLFRRESDGWRRLITPGTVDTLAKFLAASPPAFHVQAQRN